jgi:hypothetical protein
VDPTPLPPSRPSDLIVEGARQNNLKSISLRIPHNQVTAITGVSGSGKSSLAFDTIFAEGQWRYVESLSTYARMFLDKVARPDVDRILNVRPAIAIEQKNQVRTARSTVAPRRKSPTYCGSSSPKSANRPVPIATKKRAPFSRSPSPTISCFDFPARGS